MFDASPRPELLALIAAVKAEPHDDTPKLVLADWLQEQDHEVDRARGELLREIVRYNHLPIDEPDRLLNASRITTLWKEHKAAWCGPLSEAGFFCDWQGYSQAEWGLLFPIINGTKAVTKKAQAVAGSEAYAWAAGLAFGQLSSVQLQKLAQSPLLDSLIGLSMRGCNVSGAAIATLVKNPRAIGLKSLTVTKTRPHFRTIATTPHLAELRWFRCEFCRMNDTEFKELCESPHLTEVRTLAVNNNHLTIHSARAFAERSGLPKLDDLSIGGTNRIGPDGTLSLVSSPMAAQLYRLNLWSSGIADYGVEAICNQTHLCHLKELDLSGNELTNRAAVALAASEQLKTLEQLNLKTNRISSDGAIALAGSPHLANLRRLDLTGNRISSKAMDRVRERFGHRVNLD